MEDHLTRSYGINGIHIRNTKDGLVCVISEMKNIPTDKFSNILKEINNVIKEYNSNSQRNEKAIAHDKINKHAMHLLRLYMMEEDLLLHGEIITYREKEHDLLMSIRNKEFMGIDGLMNKDFFDLVHQYEDRINQAIKHSVLPDKPNQKAIDDLLFSINRKIVEKNNDLER